MGPVILRSKPPLEARSSGRLVQWHSVDVLQVAAAVSASIPVVVLVAMGYAHRWVTEDAFIDFRVVRNLLGGHGPVFNIGERVEAYTNPLWVGVLTALAALGVPLGTGSVVLGLCLSMIGVLLAQAGAWKIAVRAAAGAPEPARRQAHVPLPLGTAVFAAVPVAWDFTTSGLESSLALAWLGLVFWLLARARPVSVSGFRVVALAIGCGPLIRPDLALYSAAFAVALAVTYRREAEGAVTRSEWARLGALAAALPIGYQLFRMGYFAALVPNTALAKEATAANWLQGWRYTVDFVGAYTLWFPLLLLVPWAVALIRQTIGARDRADTAVLLAPVVGALAHWLYVVRVGGDFMHGRFLLPALFALLLPVATVLVPSGDRGSWRGASLVGIIAWAVVCAAWLRAPYSTDAVASPWGIVDERRFYIYHMQTPNPLYVRDYDWHPFVKKVKKGLLAHDRAILVSRATGLERLAALAPSVPSSIRLVVGLSNVGILGYVAGSDVHIVDRVGLADPIAARLLLAGPRGRPGHEKSLPMAWVVARFGDSTATPSRAAASDALGCGELAELLHAIQDPLTPSRFARNVGAAWRLHRLRIPADPATARDVLCARPAAHS